MPRTLKTSLLIGLFLGLNLPAFAKMEFIPMLDASLAFNATGVKIEQTDAKGEPSTSHDNSSGQNLYLYAAPNLGFTEIPGLWITPALEFEYAGANNMLNIDDEAFIFSKRYNLYYLLGLNYRFTPIWSAKLKGFGRMENSLESTDETVETGLYNYRDLGAWTEICARYGGRALPMRTRLGYKTYLRNYPNYTNADFVTEYKKTVGPWPKNLPQDLHEKDINVNELWLRQELTWGKLPFLTNLEIHGKQVNYTEMPAIQEDGTFSNDLRQDDYLELSLEFPFLLHKYHQLELDYSYCLRTSNQGVYDTNETVYLDKYYNYHQNHIRLLYNFKLASIKVGVFPPQGSISVANQRRQYFSRPSRQKANGDDATGQYVYDDPHWENNLDFGIILRQKLFAKWFNVFLSFHSIIQTSNTNIEDIAPYSYQYNTFTLGTAVSF